MFKKVAIIVFLILLVTSTFSIRLVDPISKTLTGDDYVGSVAKGTELELIFSKEFGRFNDIEITKELPKNFDIRVEDYLESIKVFVNVPKEAINSEYFFEVTLIGRDEESARIYFIVEEGLFRSSLNNYYASTNALSEANYEFSLINNSEADVNFVIDLKLPFSWVNKNEKVVFVPRNSVVKETISIFPQVSGEKTFKVLIKNPDEEKEFSLFVDANPTIFSKLKSSLNGFPFYSISQAPSFFFNSTIASFFN
jgi:hypothetical protein